MDISQHTKERNATTPQSEPLPGRENDQVANNAGGFVFALDKWKRLERFLILGTEGGTYYAKERDLTKDNHTNLIACINEDAQRVIAVTLEISLNNRAPKNDYAIYAIALVAAKAPAVEQRQAAFTAMRRICRIGTHLFQFVKYYSAFRGWSRMSRNGVAAWYLDHSVDSLATQLLKYQSREGWSHRDVIRLAHVKPTPEKAGLIAWAVNGVDATKVTTETIVHPLIDAHYRVHHPGAIVRDGSSVQALIERHKLTHEMLPTELLKFPNVWEAMLPHMGAHALLRSLGRMTAIGLLDKFSNTTEVVVAKLADKAWIKQNRVHPFSLMLTLTQYQQGHGDKGSLSWNPNPRVVDALAKALEDSISLVEPTGKRILHALDVSGSMSGTLFNTNVTCRMAECVMALASVRTEPKAEVIAFDYTIRHLPFTYNTSVKEALNLASRWDGGRTDCAQPMLEAMRRKWEIDAFVLWTDNETWAGSVHPMQALKQYRREFNPQAKMIVCGMTSTGFTISDPNDAGCLDVVGMDASVPQIIASVLKG